MKKEISTDEEKFDVLSWVRQGVLAWQRQLSNYLNLRCRNLSAKAILAILITFTALVSAALLSLIINAFH